MSNDPDVIGAVLVMSGSAVMVAFALGCQAGWLAANLYRWARARFAQTPEAQ